MPAATADLGDLVIPDRQAAPAALQAQLDRAAVPDPGGDQAGNGLETDPNPAAVTQRAITAITAYHANGQRALLDQAVALFRAALGATPEYHPKRATYLSNLNNVLSTLFERTGDLEVLIEAVEVGRAAVEATPSDHPDRADHLNNLGIALQLSFERIGDLGVLAEAVAVSRAAVESSPTDYPKRAARLNNLGGALQLLFERTGDLEVLAETVAVSRAAVEATPTDHPDHAGYLNDLGLALQMSFERISDLEVLIEAIDVGRLAVEATPTDHPERAGHLNNLGIALRMLFERTDDPKALVMAVGVGQLAVEATPADHPDRAGYLNNLSGPLRMLFERTGDLEVLGEAEAAGRAAVEATPTDHPSRAVRLNNLGNALQTLFKSTGDVEVLGEAVEVGRAAVEATPTDHPERARHLSSLGNALQMLFERTGGLEVLGEARDAFREAASGETGETFIRIAAYRRLVLLADRAGDDQDGLRCVEAAIELADTLAPGSLARADREHQLGRLAEFAGEAAAAALSAGRPDRAVELLERTRGILAADTLGIRGDDQTRLRELHPGLADRLEGLRSRLDALDHTRPGAAADTAPPDPGRQGPPTARYPADERREAHAAWQLLLDRIRAVPGFADFFRAPSISTLARHAHDGPVVFVTADPTRADALILTDTPQPVRVVPLTGLTEAAVINQANRLLDASHTAGTRDLDPVAHLAAQDEILAVLAWLWDTIAEPVLTSLGHTTTPTGRQPWPRIWWCPVGTMAYLPLHAAGHHTPQPVGTPPRTVPDLVVSSYTPTVRALAHTHTHRPDTTTLIVPVPDIPGAELPGVTTEANAIATLIPGAHTLRQPTRDDVLAALPTHRIAHFSCHGHVDLTDPARSSLILADHATTPLTLADITALNLDADLAYLSACDTAVTIPRLVDESLHITAAFHLAGYRHVIGTLWPIDDHAAAQIAEDFYAHLTTDGVPHPDRAAHALHYATTQLRTRYPATPTLWAAHTHTGGINTQNPTA